MKPGWLILLGAVILCGAGYFSSRLLGGRGCVECEVALRKAPDALAWVKNDFALSDSEFTKVCALHEAYLPKCDAMCKRMASASERLSQTLQSSPALNGEADAALREYEIARNECQRETLQHILDTASMMNPEAGRAFLGGVLPHLLTSRQHVSELHH